MVAVQASPFVSSLLAGYKNLLLKLRTHSIDDASYSGYSYEALGHSNIDSILSSFDYARLRSKTDVNRAFSKLYTALVESDIRALWQAGKQKAKQRLYQVLGTTQPHPAEVAVQDDKLKEMFGDDGYLRRSLLYTLAHLSRGFMHSLNDTEVVGLEIMEQALNRPKGQPLITVSNHVSSLDDPLVMATVVPPQHYSQPDIFRWTLCASDRCFKYKALVPAFRACKVLPVQRGGGLNQEGMQAAEERLKRGDWVHLFPEGTRSQDGGKMGMVRKGVGSLVSSCWSASSSQSGLPPLVVPVLHLGMQDVMPRGKLVPAVGKKIRVLVGNPIPVHDLLLEAQNKGWSDDMLHVAIAGRVQHHMCSLKARLEAVPQAQRLEAHDRVQLCAPVVESGLEASKLPISSLDLYDEQDLHWYHRASMWEKVKFKMQHKAWRLEAGLQKGYQELSTYHQLFESYAAAKVIHLGRRLDQARENLAAVVGLDLEQDGAIWREREGGGLRSRQDCNLSIITSRRRLRVFPAGVGGQGNTYNDTKISHIFHADNFHRGGALYPLPSEPIMGAYAATRMEGMVCMINGPASLT